MHVNIGQAVLIQWSDPNRPDEHVEEWLEENQTDSIVIREIDEESRLVWGETCDFAISMDDIVPVAV